MDGIYDTASLIGQRVKTNLGNSFTNMTAQQWIRLITVVGAYMLLRPYLLKLAERIQHKQLEREEAEREAEESRLRATISPNELRGRRIEIPDDSDSEGEDGKPAVAQWGKKARRRQRAMARRMIEDNEDRLADAEGDEEDKDIQEFLVD